MRDLQAAAICSVVAVGAAVALWFGWEHVENSIYQRGYDAAVANGQAQRRADEAANLEKERVLRAKLAEQDEAAIKRENKYAKEKDDAVRRALAGHSGMRCPATALQSASAAEDRPVAGGSESDAGRAPIVPEAAADILSIGAGYAGVLRKFDRLAERYEACRRMNNEE